MVYIIVYLLDGCLFYVMFGYYVRKWFRDFFVNYLYYLFYLLNEVNILNYRYLVKFIFVYF